MEHDEDFFDEAYQAANIPVGVEHNRPIADGNAVILQCCLLPIYLGLKHIIDWVLKPVIVQFKIQSI